MVSTLIGRARRRHFVLVVVVVLLAHAVVAAWVAREVSRFGLGADDTQRVARMDVAFVRELTPSAPPAAAVAPVALAAPPRPVAAVAPAAATPAASAPEAVDVASSAPAAADPASTPASAPSPDPPASAAAPAAVASAPATAPLDALPVAAAASAASAVAAAPAATAASQAIAFEWPPSTRLRYRLSGNFRGEVHGSAQVQWVLVGTRYQVHLDVQVGPSFAPLVSRRMTSDGEVGPRGLQPLRYDEETSVAFRAPKRAEVRFGPDVVRLSNGREVAPLPGVQDTASQFVQMTWMFTVDPSRLQTGRVLEMPLALPRRQEVWLYDVLGTETIDTPMGPVETVHLKPRRVATTGSDLTAEAWFAPSMQYLPVRILIRQDEQTHVDLIVDGPPMQAAR